MTQIFKENGDVVPCTIVDVADVRVIGKKTEKTDGYMAVILGIGSKRKPSKAEIGKFKKLKYVPGVTFEFRMNDLEKLGDYNIGDKVNADLFKVGDIVNVTGVTKGKGFQGVVKRWRFKGGPRTHGQSDRERSPGSIGGGTTPGRVFKGKKMPGRMGNKKKTILNIEIVKVDAKNSILCLRGAVPGGRNSMIKIHKSK